MSPSTIERIERADPNEPSVGKVLALKSALHSKSIDALISPETSPSPRFQGQEIGVEARRQEYFDFLLRLARGREASGQDSSDILDRIGQLMELDART
jgi:hypothetical protein